MDLTKSKKSLSLICSFALSIAILNGLVCLRKSRTDYAIQNDGRKGGILITEIEGAQHSLIIRCSDWRLGSGFKKWMTEKIPLNGIPPYLIYIPGPTYVFANGDEAIRKFWRVNIGTFIRNKNIKKVIICGHEDCFVYNQNMGKCSPQDDKKRQIADMKKIKTIIREKYPHIEIILVYASLPDKKKKKFNFEIIEG